MPTKEWLALYEKKRGLTLCPNDLNAYFSLDMLVGRQLALVDLGPVSLPTGRVLVRDPMAYLDDEEEPYFQSVPAGEYRATACVVAPAEEGKVARYAAVRVCMGDTPAVRFEEAMLGIEKLDTFDEGEYFGFNVDTGIACICDEEARDAFCAFAEGWTDAHPEGDLYADYFAALFAANAQKSPKYQREEGDWLNWQVPGTELHIPFFQSGFGEGSYPVYFGYDRAGSICQMVVQFIDIEMAFGEPHD